MFERSATELHDVIDAFKSLQANLRLKEAYYLQVRAVKRHQSFNGLVTHMQYFCV